MNPFDGSSDDGPKMKKNNKISLYITNVIQLFENNLNRSIFSFCWIYNTTGVAGVMHKLYLFIAKLLKTATAHNSPIIYRRTVFWYQSVWRRRRRRIPWIIGFKDNYYIIPLRKFSNSSFVYRKIVCHEFDVKKCTLIKSTEQYLFYHVSNRSSRGDVLFLMIVYNAFCASPNERSQIMKQNFHGDFCPKELDLLNLIKFIDLFFFSIKNCYCFLSSAFSEKYRIQTWL